MTNAIYINEPSKQITYGTAGDDYIYATSGIWFNLDGGAHIYGDYLYLSNPFSSTTVFDIKAQTIKSGKQTIAKMKNIEGLYLSNQGSDVIVDADKSGLFVFDTASGDDIYYAGVGNKVYEGNAGFDSILFDKSSKAITVNLTESPLNDLQQKITSGDSIYLITHVEKIGGSTKNDNITISTNGYLVDGFKGNDTITGGVNNDSIGGGAGRDILTGGEGGDVFIFAASGTSNIDTITDFQRGLDKIQMSPSVFGSLGLITSENIVNADRALDGNDFLIIKADSQGNATLFYDADGSGSRSNLLIVAKLMGVSALGVEDFWAPPI